MITIQSILLFALGVLCAMFLVLLIAPALWRRAVRLTTERVMERMPISEAEIRADKDRLRVKYAIKVHRLELQADDAKLKQARQLIEINRRDASISGLETEVNRLGSALEENQNARRVLEQTVSERLPKVEQRLVDARHLLFHRDREINDLNQAAKAQAQALGEARAIHQQQSAEIERLSVALKTREARRRTSPRDPHFDGEVALRAEIEALRAKSRDQAALITRLQSVLRPGAGPGHNADEPTVQPADQAALERAREGLAEAEVTLKSARSTDEAADAAMLRSQAEQISRLKAAGQDQAAEVTRLKAALAVFEGAKDADGKLTIKDSKIALKARVSALQAQTDSQAQSIQRLRAELAASNERAALQAQHFKMEMKRLGGGTHPANGVGRRTAYAPPGSSGGAPRAQTGAPAAAKPQSLTERIRQPRDAASGAPPVRSGQIAPAPGPTPVPSAVPSPAPKPAGTSNSRAATERAPSSSAKPDAGGLPPAAAAPSSHADAGAAASATPLLPLKAPPPPTGTRSTAPTPARVEQPAPTLKALKTADATSPKKPAVEAAASAKATSDAPERPRDEAAKPAPKPLSDPMAALKAAAANEDERAEPPPSNASKPASGLAKPKLPVAATTKPDSEAAATATPAKKLADSPRTKPAAKGLSQRLADQRLADQRMADQRMAEPSNGGSRGDAMPRDAAASASAALSSSEQAEADAAAKRAKAATSELGAQGERKATNGTPTTASEPMPNADSKTKTGGHRVDEVADTAEGNGQGEGEGKPRRSRLLERITSVGKPG